MSDVSLNNGARHTITIAILGDLIDGEEACVVALRANCDGDLRVIIRLQNFACLPHIIQFLLNDMLVLALTNTITKVEDTQRDLSSICLKRAEECTHELDHIFSDDDFFTIAVGIGDRSEAGTLHYKLKDISIAQTDEISC